jgi:S-(hydroxymethyl)glutathione dehydrogenase/alcohol dehydrogenase
LETRAAVFWEVGRPLTVERIDLDQPRPNEVVVRMHAVGVCGTDLHQVRGDWHRPVPMVLGHEGSGVVEEVGSAVTRVASGDRVVLSWAPSCGSCGDCRRGRPAACVPLHRAIDGGTLIDGRTGLSLAGEAVYRGTATGCLAERVVVREDVALPIGDDVPLDQAALLGCAALTGVGAVLFVAHPRPGVVVLVLGAGGVGQFVVQGAQLADAGVIVAVDPFAGRREQALRLGATHAVAPDDLTDLLADLAPDGADVALDAVGNPETTATALRHTRSGGTTVLVGLPGAGLRLDLEPGEFVRREKWLTGTMYGSEDPAIALPILVEHVRAGRLDLASLLGETYSLDRVDEAVQASLAGTPGRVLVTP